MSVRQGARCWAVIPAAGRGERMAGGTPKQYLPLGGATLIEHAVRPFLDHPRFAAIVVVLPAGDAQWSRLGCARTPGIETVSGGDERVHSVRNGLAQLAGRAQPDDWAVVHDGARPCLGSSDLDRLLAALDSDPVGGLLALPVADTLKRADAGGMTSTGTVDRAGLWAAQTPQMFRFALLERAIAQAIDNGVAVTDEAHAVERLGQTPRLIMGSVRNLKVTRAEDLALAEAILKGAHA